MIEISEIFEESQKGNGIVILIRFSGVLEKAIKILDIYRKGIAKKVIQEDLSNNNNDNNPDDDSEDSSDSDNENGRRKR